MKRTRTFVSLIILFAALVTGCDDDVTGPSMAEVAGMYSASTFLLNAPEGQVDMIADGTTLDLTLSPDGTTSGTLFIPEGEEDGSDLTADLEGEWALDGDDVTFDHDADTFVRDVTWEYDDGLLVSNSTFAEVVLVPQEPLQ